MAHNIKHSNSTKENTIRVNSNLGSYLGLCVKRTDTGATVDVPDTDVSVTGAAAGCQNVWLPWAPSQSLKKKEKKYFSLIHLVQLSLR